MKQGTGIAPAKEYRGMTTADPLREMERRMNRLFGFAPEWPDWQENFTLKAWAPACDIYETDAAVIVKAELPEVKREDVKVSIENNVLTLTGERKLEEETKRDNYHRVERNYGQFLRSFTLPNNIDPAQITAEFQNGMLNITLPKRAEAKPKEIEVNVK
jgi:HSP20 family protein